VREADNSPPSSAKVIYLYSSNTPTWRGAQLKRSAGAALPYNGTVHQLFIDLKKAYDSVKGEVLYNILIEFGRTQKLSG
jgi:hypothetical protein